MRSLLRALPLSLLLGGLFPAAAATPSADPLAAQEAAWQALFDHAAPAVVFIANAAGLGSGFLVSSDGLILTNAHVVEGASTVDVVLYDGRKLTGAVVERGKNVDLALVRIGATGLPTLPLGWVEGLRVGSFVASVGHGQGGGWTFTTGMVSNMYAVGTERPVFQTQIPLNPGNSGGPVLNRQGEVMGVVTAGILEAQNINFAIKIDVALRSLSALEPFCDCLVVRAPEGVPIFVDGKPAGQGPRALANVSAGAHKVFAVINGKRVEATITFPAQHDLTLSAD